MAEPQILKEPTKGIEDTLILQAEKISTLLVENERLGALNSELQQKVTLLEKDNVRLLEWYKLTVTSLQTSDLLVAKEQFDVLWGYVQAMGSPGHRVVTFFSRQIGKIWLGRFCKRSVKWIYAVIKA